MKKLLLTLVTLVTATAASAQIVIWNGDEKETGSDGGFWNRADPTVVEEEGNKVLKITPKSNPGGWEQEHHNAALAVGDINFKGLRRISFRIKMADKHNVELQLEGDGFNAKRAVYYDTPNEWKTLVYEFGTGGESDKITDTNSNVIAIWPYEETSEGEGKTIYIDDIMIEGPMIGEALLSSKADESLTDQQVIVTGAMRKGECSDLNNGWAKITYNDFALLYNKISAEVCFLNLTGAAVSDGDGPQLRTKNSNLMILSKVEFDVKDNVITWDGSKNVTSKLVLKDDAPFYTPIDFTATDVELTRNVQAGINSFCLPFEVTPSEVKSTKIATFKGGVTFTTAESVAANTPFITVDATKVQGMTFSNKTIATVTNDIVGETFQGIYVPQTSTAAKYGINSAGKIQEGAADIKCNAFRAWLTTIPASARSIDIDGETTGISNVSLENPVKEIYNLNGVRVNKIGNKGIYIINGKKVIVK
mgnify:CR=1 FL=1